jgi:hypothetical protein
MVQRFGQFRPIVALAGLDLEIGCEELRVVALAGNERGYGGLLRLDRP